MKLRPTLTTLVTILLMATACGPSDEEMNQLIDQRARAIVDAMPTFTPQVIPTPLPTATLVATVTPVPTATFAPTSTPQPTATPQPIPTPVPTATPQPTATPIPTKRPTRVPTPTLSVVDWSERLEPYIVQIVSSDGSGTGFFIQDPRDRGDWYLVTNAHVVGTDQWVELLWWRDITIPFAKSSGWMKWPTWL